MDRMLHMPSNTIVLCELKVVMVMRILIDGVQYSISCLVWNCAIGSIVYGTQFATTAELSLLCYCKTSS